MIFLTIILSYKTSSSKIDLYSPLHFHFCTPSTFIPTSTFIREMRVLYFFYSGSLNEKVRHFLKLLCKKLWLQPDSKLTTWLRWDNQFIEKSNRRPPWVPPDHFNVAIINFLKAIWEILAFHGAHCNDCQKVSNDSTLFHFSEVRKRQLLIQLKRAGICL